jgi:hypothetical protein
VIQLPALAGRLVTGLVECGKKETSMKKRIPLIAIIIVVAICIANKDEIKQMFNKGEDKVINCSICEEKCPCIEAECVCVAACKCENCIT